MTIGELAEILKHCPPDETVMIGLCGGPVELVTVRQDPESYRTILEAQAD